MENINEFINQLIIDTKEFKLEWSKISYEDYRNLFDSVKQIYEENDDNFFSIDPSKTTLTLDNDNSNVYKIYVWTCIYNGVNICLIKKTSYLSNVITMNEYGLSLINQNKDAPFVYEVDLDAKGNTLILTLENVIVASISKIYEKRAERFIKNALKRKNNSK